METKVSSKETARKTLLCAVKGLIENGGEMNLSDLLDYVEKHTTFSEGELVPNKNGLARWKTTMQFYSIDAVKAGFLIKKQGVWQLTDDGTKAYQNKTFMEQSEKAYKVWVKAQKQEAGLGDDLDVDTGTTMSDKIEQLQAEAKKGFQERINTLNPYEFQELVAALLRSMDYYTPYVSPPGKDNGIDIIAYRDPLGTSANTLKVQVKHYTSNPISVDVVRALRGILQQGEMGLIVSSGTFTQEAKREARTLHPIIRLIDINEFIELWITYHQRMAEADKNLLPIVPIFYVK